MGRKLKAVSSNNNDNRKRTTTANTNRSATRNLYCLFILLIIWTSLSLIPSAFNAEKWSTTEVLLMFSNNNNKSSTLLVDNQQPRIRETTNNNDNEIPIEEEEEAEPPIIKSVVCIDHKPSTDPNIGKKEISTKFVEKTEPKFWISLHTRHFDLLRWNSIMDKGEYYETGLTKQFHEILYNKQPGLVIDVGMNIGWFTLYSRSMGHNVIGFDPNPIMHSRVCESLELNNWNNDNSVELVSYGLGDHVDTLNLTTGKNPGMSSFHEDRLAPRFRKKIVVPVTTLDIMAKQKGWLQKQQKQQQNVLIHLLKVDVEGYEPYVFRGAKQLIQSNLIQNIIMENSVTNIKDVIEMFGLLAKSNYRIHLLSNVNGEPFHFDLIEPTNQVLEDYVAADEKIETTTTNTTLINGLSYFATSSMNVWWQLRTPPKRSNDENDFPPSQKKIQFHF